MQKKNNNQKKKKRIQKQSKQSKMEWEAKKERIAKSAKPRLRPARSEPEKWLKKNYPTYFQHLTRNQISIAWRLAHGNNERFLDQCRRMIYHYNPNYVNIISTPIGGQPPHIKRPPESY
ncbi:MAG: hypothetical protein KJ069_07720 [Anaerolineae bacterium]|nr:hypothetical protein [Anaerolineae bacterium]